MKIIRMPDHTVASWGNWQALYRLRRNRLFSKILDMLAGDLP